MDLAILLPIRSGGSGGFIKHLAGVIPFWRCQPDCGRLAIFAPTGIINGLGTIGAELVEVPSNDYRTKFRHMGRLVEAKGYDVALCTTARPVKISNCPVVTMIQNIEPIQRPVYQMPLIWRLRLLLLRREHISACRQATRVVAVSRYVREEAYRRFRISLKKVDIVYHGYDPAESEASCLPSISLPTTGFIFGAGSIVPYRGFEDLIRAIARIRATNGDAPTVVLAGIGAGPSRSYERFLRSLVHKLGVEDRVIWAGQLSREEMNWCFQHARLFVQTSRAESFSNIQVEALGNGCLIGSCDHPPMPEILANGALYYPTGKDSALADLINRVFSMSPEEEKILKSAARIRANFFSWDKTADQTWEILKRAAIDHKKEKKCSMARLS